jgi:hypothetical protein
MLVRYSPRPKSAVAVGVFVREMSAKTVIFPSLLLSHGPDPEEDVDKRSGRDK